MRRLLERAGTVLALLFGLQVAWFERLFVFFTLLNGMGIVTGLAQPYLRGDDPEIVSASTHQPQVWCQLALLGGGLLIACIRSNRILFAARKAWPIILFILLAPLSIAWSMQPMLTLRRSGLLLGSAVIALYLGERYTIEQFARLLARTMAVMMAAVIGFYFFAPAYVIDPAHEGAWKGLSSQKNAFGEYMAMAVVLFLVVRFRRCDWLRVPLLGCAVVLLYLSHSATALVVCAVTIVIYPLLRLTQMGRKHTIPVCIVGFLVLLQALLFLPRNINPLLAMLGRDATLTGRTGVWEYVAPAIARAPYLGYGYAAFWQGLKGSSLDIMIVNKWLVPTAHNGYLDLCLSFGALGVIALLLVLFLLLGRAFRFAKYEPVQTAFWPLSFLCLFLLQNLGESLLLYGNELSFMVFLTMFTSLALHRTREPVTVRFYSGGPIARKQPASSYPAEA